MSQHGASLGGIYLRMCYLLSGLHTAAFTKLRSVDVVQRSTTGGTIARTAAVDAVDTFL